MNVAIRIAAGLLGVDVSDEDEDEDDSYEAEDDYEAEAEAVEQSSAESEPEEAEEWGHNLSDPDLVESYNFTADGDDMEADMNAEEQDGEDDNFDDNEAPMEHAQLPIVLTDFPVLIPPVGPNYETDQHRKLLVVTESPFLPEGSSFGAKEWYGTDQAALQASGDLTQTDLAYLNLRDNIEIGNESGKWLVGGKKSHPTYEEVNDVLKGILGTEGNVLKEEIAYDNWVRLFWNDVDVHTSKRFIEFFDAPTERSGGYRMAQSKP